MDLVKYIFTIPGVKSFLSNKLCQDPLEKYFGRQRQKGGANENPNASQFLKNQQSLRVINSINIGSIKGNCRGSTTTKSLENSLLRKRKRKQDEGSPPTKYMCTTQSETLIEGILM